MNRYIITFITLGIGLSSANADDSATAAGKALNDQNCVRCHGPELYTRKDRMVNSRDALFTQVQRCETNLQLQWFNEETKNVADYLNKEHYHFK